MKRWIAISVSAVIALSSTLFFINWDKPDAIIILPGIMGSELYLGEDIDYGDKHFVADTKLWIDTKSISQLINVSDYVELLAYDENLDIYTAEPIINDCEFSGNYGTLDMYSSLYETLYDNLGEECDIVFYSYDWRESPCETAIGLDNFLNDKNYDKISIVAHSMGGLVASNYFAMGEEQRDRICTYISLGTPYLGSVQAEYAMATGNISEFFANILISTPARSICPQLDSMYSLLPYEHLWQSSLSLYSLSGTQNSKSLIDEQEILSQAISGYSKERHEKAQEDNKALFTNDGQHIAQLVNSYYVVGDGVDTVTKVNLPKNTSLVAALTTTTKTPSGDGTVSLYSSTVGNTLPSHRIFVKQDDGKGCASHHALIDGSERTTLEFIVAVLTGKADKLSADELKSNYNIKKGVPVFD